MSFFSTIFGDAVKLFEAFAGSTPAAQQAATDARTAAQSAEAAVAAILDPIVDEAMAKLPFGALADPVMDNIIKAFADKVLAKLSPAGAAVHAQATMQPIGD